MYDVFVEGLEFYAHHGVTDEEQAIGHRYLADISVSVEGKAQDSDQIGDTVDYAALAALMLSVSASTRYRTVEAFANHYCQEVLVTMPLVNTVEVKLMKPLPPAAMIAKATGVRFVRQRAVNER